MRVLLFADTVLTEAGSGAARSVWLMLRWLSGAGHAVHAVTGGRFEQSPGLDAAAHNDLLGVPIARDTFGARPVARYDLHGVAITSVETVNAVITGPDPGADHLLAVYDRTRAQFRPDLVLTYGGHACVREAMRRARRVGTRTLFTVRGLGFDEPDLFAHADRILTNSAFMARRIGARTGVQADWLPSPIEWSAVQGPAETRGFVTIIDPAPHNTSPLTV